MPKLRSKDGTTEVDTTLMKATFHMAKKPAPKPMTKPKGKKGC